jgi:ubiquitin-activating enzyme E1 C
MACQAVLFPEPVAYQLCTIANTPRIPEQCVALAVDMAWEKHHPDTKLDGDNDDHINWILEAAIEHGNKFGITGITFSMARGVVKRIVPAIASTQSIIAASCATQVIKILTKWTPTINNNLMITSNNGIYAHHFLFERQSNCDVCQRKLLTLPFIAEEIVADFKKRVELLFDMPNCSIRTADKSIYINYIPSKRTKT